MNQSFTQRFLDAYMGESALTYRRARALFFLHMLFVPSALTFTGLAWVLEGYTAKIPMLAILIVLLLGNLWLLNRGGFTPAVLLTLLYSLSILSSTVYLAEPPRHELLYNLGLFSVLTILLAGLISLKRRDSVLIAGLSLAIISYYFFAMVVPESSIPMEEYAHNYFAVIILIILAAVMGTSINEQTRNLFSELEGINEKLEETVQERTNALVESEKLAALGSMVGGISHEINTPLGNSVTIVSHLLNEFESISGSISSGDLTRSRLQDFTRTGLEAVQAAERNLGAARNLVTNFKRIAADLHHQTASIVDIRDELEMVVGSLEGQLRSRGDLDVNVQGPQGLRLAMYPGLLWQVYSNLISNSLTHGINSHGGRITISFELRAGQLELGYADNGSGMDEKTLKHHFEPFFTTARGKGSTGLGMNLVYNLLVAVGGRISVESSPGNGVSYRMTIPRIEVQAPQSQS